MVTKTKEIRVRVTRTQHERIRNNAESQGKSISQYIRNLALEHDINITYKILEIYNIVKDMQINLIRK